MRERPILFSGPMVRALLDGNKTQTRRIMKPQPKVLKNGTWYAPYAAEPTKWCYLLGDRQHGWAKCPYGSAGTELWVRETFAEVGGCDPGLPVYRANYPACVPREYQNVPPADEVRWRPSIHMPRRLSRISLLITDVRVQRLQDISEEDAKAEGVEPLKSGRGYYSVEHGRVAVRFGIYHDFAKEAFAELWSHINGADSWDANPWVWAISFSVESR